MPLHSQRRNRRIRRAGGGLFGTVGRVLAVVGMVATTLTGVSVATQRAASAVTAFPDNFMAIDGNVRYNPTGNAAVGWAYSGSGAANTCDNVGAVNVVGTNGLYNCGSPNPLNTGNTTYVPLPPHYVGPTPLASSVLSQAFQTAPSTTDTVQCTTNPTTTALGSYQFGGGDKFSSGLSQLSYSVGQQPPPKDVATDSYVISRINSNGEVEAYFGAQRTNNNGDSHVDFQFLQDNVTMTQSTAGNSCAGGFAGSREQGDVLVELNYTNGGSVPAPNVYIWTCSTANSQVGTKCDTSGSWVPKSVPNGAVVENVNSAPIPCGGWVCEGSLGPSQIDTNEFVEGAIDFGQLTGFSTGCGSSVFVETRSSQAADAQVKALTRPTSFADCAPTDTKTTPSVGAGQSLSLGSSLTDGVTVTGNTAMGAPQGNVTFYVCAIPANVLPQGCTPANGTQLAGVNPVKLVDGSATSPSYKPPAAGHYCFAGVFTPDTGTFYSGSSDTSADECFTVNTIAPPFVTSITSPADTSVGNSWNDTATLTGTDPYGAPTGSVSFNVCKVPSTSAACSSGGTAVGTVTAPSVNGVTATYALPAVDAYTPGSVGTYCYYVSYTATAGGNYSSKNIEDNTECFTVTAAPSVTNTIAKGSTLPFGAGVIDNLTVTGNSSGGAPSGTATFYLCQTSIMPATPATCPLQGTPFESNVALTPDPNDPGISVASSTPTGSMAPGTWCFSAIYSPDSSSNYLGSQDNTAPSNADPAECFSVATFSPIIATSVVNENPASNVTGASYHDTAGFTSTGTGVIPTGSVTYTLYNTPDCSGVPLSTSTVGLISGVVPNSPSTGPLGAGDYCYLAKYSGDTFYNSAAAAIEPFSIQKSPTTISTTVQDTTSGTEWDLVNGELAPASAQDTYAYTSGLVAGFTPTGKVTYKLYSLTTPGDCTNGVTLLGTDVELAPHASSVTSGLTDGYYGYVVSYFGDSNYAGSQESCEPFRVIAPKLTAVKSASPSPGLVPIGQAITYTIALTNSGDGPANNVLVTDAIPAGTTVQLGSASSSPINGSGSVTSSGLSWTFSSPIEPGATQSVSFTVTVSSGDLNGQKIDNFAVFTNENTPNCSTVTCDTNTVEHTVGLPIIDVGKSEVTPPGDGNPVTAGQSLPITYTLAVTNAGLLPAKDVVVNDAIPAGATYVMGSAAGSPNVTFDGSTLTWTISSVPAEASTVPGEVDLSFQVTVNASDPDGSTIVNQASFENVNTGDCTPNPASSGFCLTNQVSNPVLAPIVNAVKSSSPASGSTVPAGSQVTYTISLTNAGHAGATETVADVVPTGTTFVSATAGGADNAGTVTWTNVSVPAGTTSANPVQVSFVVTVDLADANGTLIPNHAIFDNNNTPTCITSGDTSASTCDTNTVTLTVVKPVINVVKSEPTPGDGQSVTAGQSAPITYNLSVSNTGLQDATDLTVTDVIPAGATYVPGSANLGGTFDSTTHTVTWALATVPAAVDGVAGVVEPLSFQVTVNASDANGSTITNQAAFSDVNTVNCTAGAASGTCLTNKVSNPVIAITPTSSTAPQVAPTTTVPKPALAFTGANARALVLFAVTLVGSGLLLVILGRRRRRSNG